ncbi:hypothetical protein L1987_43828 [Smallanthus sonchifolius]|uniref:Uncharacterized protein n=1 Tax=Smallanthus sonchifolius TaxID=185202 RepID=A0ACB9GNG9_9ASTR|nr:hypothetical protein L1987_43828 [Smallanthus sonchifolius]
MIPPLMNMLQHDSFKELKYGLTELAKSESLAGNHGTSLIQNQIPLNISFHGFSNEEEEEERMSRMFSARSGTIQKKKRLDVEAEQRGFVLDLLFSFPFLHEEIDRSLLFAKEYLRERRNENRNTRCGRKKKNGEEIGLQVVKVEK